MLRITPLIVVLIVAVATVIVGLAAVNVELVVIGLTTAALCAVIDRMRGETSLTLGRDGFSASGTLIGPADIEREARQLLAEVGLGGEASEETRQRVRAGAEQLFPPDDPVVVRASAGARRRLSRAIAADLLAGRCAICGVSAADVPLEAAHIRPLSAGGDTTRENLVALCPNCHRRYDTGSAVLPSR